MRSLPAALPGYERLNGEIPIVHAPGMEERASHFVHQLSGGEQQRTAIARALIHRPSLLLADEPTGNLDSASAEAVMRVLTRVGTDQLATLIIVTHSEEVARSASRRVAMRDGRIVA